MGNGENESPLKKALIYNQIEFFYDITLYIIKVEKRNTSFSTC